MLYWQGLCSTAESSLEIPVEGRSGIIYILDQWLLLRLSSYSILSGLLYLTGPNLKILFEDEDLKGKIFQTEAWVCRIYAISYAPAIRSSCDVFWNQARAQFTNFSITFPRHASGSQLQGMPLLSAHKLLLTCKLEQMQYGAIENLLRCRYHRQAVKQSSIRLRCQQWQTLKTIFFFFFIHAFMVYAFCKCRNLKAMAHLTSWTCYQKISLEPMPLAPPCQTSHLCLHLGPWGRHLW